MLAALGINHPNIIEVIDVGQAEDASLFLVMELLTGVSLDVAVRRQQPPMLAYEFMLLMRGRGRGLGGRPPGAGSSTATSSRPTSSYTRTGTAGWSPRSSTSESSKILEEEQNNMALDSGRRHLVLGSPLYMSPEQAMGAAGIDGRTDVFAFGGMIFEALTGQRAFDAPNFNALIVTIATKQPKSIDDVGRHYPEVVRALIRECMVTDRTKRLASFDRIVERLRTLLPELERSHLKLPSPYGTERSSDPDATNALPVVIVRPSERPQPAAPPPGGYASHSALQVSNGQHNSPLAMQISNLPSQQDESASPPKSSDPQSRDWLESVGAYVRQLSPRTVVIAAGAGGTLVLLAIFIPHGRRIQRRGGDFSRGRSRVRGRRHDRARLVPPHAPAAHRNRHRVGRRAGHLGRLFAGRHAWSSRQGKRAVVDRGRPWVVFDLGRWDGSRRHAPHRLRLERRNAPYRLRTPERQGANRQRERGRRNSHSLQLYARRMSGDEAARALERAIADACFGVSAAEDMAREPGEFFEKRGVATEDVQAILDAPARLGVYRDLVRNGLSGVVARMLPRTRARMNAAYGGRFDADFARFIDEVGPRTHYLRDLPGEFLAWAVPRWRADPSVPAYLPDLASFEVAYFAVAASAPVLETEPLVEVALDRPLAFAESTRLMHCTWAIHELPGDESATEEPPCRAVHLLAYRDAAFAVRWSSRRHWRLPSWRG